MAKERYKVNIEFHSVGDGRQFVNFWNHFNGDDVVCEVIGDKLLLHRRDENGDSLEPKEVTLFEVFDMIDERVKAWDK